MGVVAWFLTVELVPTPSSRMAREQPQLKGALVSLVCPAVDGEQARARALAALDGDGYRVTELVDFGLVDESSVCTPRD